MKWGVERVSAMKRYRQALCAPRLRTPSLGLACACTLSRGVQCHARPLARSPSTIRSSIGCMLCACSLPRHHMGRGVRMVSHGLMYMLGHVPCDRCVRTPHFGHGLVSCMIAWASGEVLSSSCHFFLHAHESGQCGGSEQSTQKLAPHRQPSSSGGARGCA